MQNTEELAIHSSGELANFRRQLKRWFRRHGRRLPWRETRDPYRIWVSEIMLQQTQVATVVDYYHRFMERFPTIASLAEAAEQDVLAMWSGLGYYRRARQLHAAAKQLIEQYDGQFPENLDAVLALPGIGRYTAGAITSFAFDAPSPIVEANTIRLYSRLLALESVPTTAAAQRRLWTFSETLLPPHGPGSAEINQAVMELGSLVCKPTKPHCDACPVVTHCAAHKRGIQEQLPISKPKTAAETRAHVCVLIEKQGRYLLRQNQAGAWWEGLWDFPRCDITAQLELAGKPLDRPPPPEFTSPLLHAEFATDCVVERHYRTLRHGVTRYKIILHCYLGKPASLLAIAGGATGAAGLQVAEAEGRPPQSQYHGSLTDDAWRWVDLDEVALPLTSTAQKLRKLLLAAGQRASQPSLF